MKHYQRFEIKGASLIELWFDPDLINGLFILSDRDEQGQPAAIVHQMKFYNRLFWENSLDINKKYPNLNFMFKQTGNAITYEKSIQMGLMISEPDQQKRQTLLLFSSPFNYSVTAQIQILASYTVDSPMVSSIIDTHGNIWIAYTNGSYQMLEFDFNNKGQAYISLKKQFKICESGLFQSVLIFTGVIKGEEKKNSDDTDSKSDWDSNSSLNDIHLMLVAPSRMIVY